MRITPFIALLLCGCASFSSHQIEVKLDGTRIESQQSIVTFFDSKTSIAKMRASTTDKTQGLTVGGFEQESSGTNAINLIEAVTRGAMEGAAKALVK